MLTTFQDEEVSPSAGPPALLGATVPWLLLLPSCDGPWAGKDFRGQIDPTQNGNAHVLIWPGAEHPAL